MMSARAVEMPRVRARRRRAAGGAARGHLTIRDVAALAGVSQGTVSKVLNDAPGVGPATRSRILKVIEDLDYHPDASARSLVARRTGSIGMIIPHTGGYSMSTGYWPVLLTTITEAAAARDLNVLLSTAVSEEDVDSAYRSILRGRRVDGLVVGAEQFGQKQLVELLFKGFPFVTVGKSRFVSHWNVDVDNEGGARDMTAHLVGVGHRDIAMLAGPAHFRSVQERVEGYRQAMAAAGLEARAHHCAYHDESALRVIRELLADRPRPSALFLSAGDLVPPALAACRDLGLRLPDDLALGAFDDHPYYEHFDPPVTAVSQPIHDLGRAAAALLFALMEGTVPEKRDVVLPTRLVVRRSCGSRA
jgi:LacI family transcriptional regulator